MIFFEKWRKSLRGTNLSHKINCQPSPMTLKDSKDWFKHVDDKKIIRDNTLPWFYYTFLVVGNLLASYAIYFDLASESGYRHWIVYFGSSLFFMVGILVAIYAFYMPKKIVIFDRLAGTITLGGPYWIKPITILFNDVKTFMRTEYTYLSSEIVLNIYRPDLYKQNVAFNFMKFEDIERDWAFYLWYMDKTRELPPGDAFDAYRVEDARRRQRELNEK